MPVRILIVDDSPEDCQLYRRRLDQQSGHEYDVTETDSGEDGLEICQSDPPDCILLDYNLPDLDGLEFLTELGKIGEHHIAVVMLTGQGNESIAVEAMKKGAQDYLVKGDLSSENLRRAVSLWLEPLAAFQYLVPGMSRPDRWHKLLRRTPVLLCVPLHH